MPLPKKYSTEQFKDWYNAHESGETFSSMSKRLGIPEGTLRSAVSRYRATLAIEDKIKEAGVTLHKEDEDKPVERTKKLSDFTPREIIKYLYSIGYRIDREGLYYIEKKRVNLDSVINE